MKTHVCIRKWIFLAIITVFICIAADPAAIVWAGRAGQAPPLPPSAKGLPSYNDIVSKIPALRRSWQKIGNRCYNAQGKVIEGAITRGIDVSEWDYLIDWQQVAGANVDFAFIRISHGTYYMDQYYDYNMRNANAAGIPVGTYIYSAATTFREALEEAQLAIRKMNGYKVSYPVAFDLEDSSIASLPREKISRIAMTFCTEIKKAGYTPIIYCNQNWYNNHLDFNIIQGVDVWLASYSDRFNHPDNSLYKYTIWQATAGDSISEDYVTTRGLIPGIPVSVNADIDFGFYDYTKSVKPRTGVVSAYRPSADPPYMEDGWDTSGGNTYYYVNGSKVTGRYKINGIWYYFTKKGVLRRNQLLKVSGKVFYLDENGLRVKNRFVELNGNTYYCQSDYCLAAGLTKIGTKYYFFDENSHSLLKSQKIIREKKIYFANAKGVLLASRFLTVKENKKKNTYYLSADGSAVLGFRRINGKKYFFYRSASRLGIMARNATVTRAGIRYTYGDDGVLVSMEK